MLVAAFFCGIDIPFNRVARLFDRLSIAIIKPDIILCQTCNLLILDKVHITCIFEDRGHIGGNQIAVLGFANDERRILAQCIDMIRLLCKNDAERIRTLHAVHNLGDRIDDVTVCLFIIVV